VGKWESRVLGGGSKRGGKVVLLTFPRRVFSRALAAAFWVAVVNLRKGYPRMHHLRLGAWVFFTLLVIGGTVRADLVNTIPAGALCGGDSFQGKEKLGTVTDKAGDVFTLYCVNRDYFQGSVFVKSTGVTTDFGRCLYPYGVNLFNYEVDKNNNFTGIEWVNVWPPKLNGETRDQLAAVLSNKGDPTDKWLEKVDIILKVNKLDSKDKNTIYQFPFSPNNFPFSPYDQEIASFEDGVLVTKEVLTPDEANAAYLDDGYSPIPDLVIDPLMRVPDASFQEEGTPEPSAFWLFASGLLVGIAFVRWRAVGG
jgi:hypothetical protein